MFQLRTLGTLALERDGVPVEGISIHRNALALLAILAADGATSRDRVMALLWPESDSDRASGSLRQLLHHLRHRLGATDLFLGRPQLALDPAMIGSDVERFREALAAGEFATAASLYRGPFLDGAHFNGSPELEQWIDERRTALARDHAVALERAAEASNAGGDLRGAVLWWERRQELDPLDGRVTLELMRALAAAGRRHTALELAQAHSTLLLQETGLPPDPGVTTLAESLRQSLAAAPDPAAGALP
ncbi:MAG TPA: BTAD domain-containing putative transcriptional regulator, partial [Gemmatimonadales bacterium]|nr:BTAD domain-containing putative transcriptional regulator [Gemmatimonadales bacterium]